MYFLFDSSLVGERVIYVRKVEVGEIAQKSVDFGLPVVALGYPNAVLVLGIAHYRTDFDAV